MSKFRSTSVRKRRGMWWAAVAVLCLAAAVPWQPAVSIAIPGEAPLVVFPLRPEEQFSIRFIHSIDGLPIIERYTLDGAELVQTETRLLSFGIGTGYVEGDGVLTEDGEWVVIADMDRRIGKLRQRAGVESVDHTIVWRDRALRLSHMFPDTLFVIEGTRLSLFDGIHFQAALLWNERRGAQKGRLWQTL